MKLTIVLLIGFMMTVSAANSYSQKTKLDINLSNTTIKDLFGYIEQKQQIRFSLSERRFKYFQEGEY